jgi:polar amino acid transport system permease protein
VQPAKRPVTVKRILNATPVAVGLYVGVIVAIGWASYTGAMQMGYNWQWYQVPKYIYTFTDDGFQAGEILTGLWATIVLSTVSFILATVLGLCVALLRLSGLVVGKGVTIGYLEFIRNIPLLVLLYLFYYVLGPVFGFDRWTAAVLSCRDQFYRARTMGSRSIDRNDPRPVLSLYYFATICAFYAAAAYGRGCSPDQIIRHC